MSEASLILVLDEGTSSTRALAYGADGKVHASCSRPLTQHYPGPGLVEHDADEIWQETLACGREVVRQVGGPERIAAIGITNQRETVVVWDRRTGAPLHRAIVWQDRRTADACEALRAGGHEAEVQRRTGLLLDPYFSGTKMGWLLGQPAVADAGDALALGTIDSWLTWKLTAGAAHVTDASNASRTLLMALSDTDWDDSLCDLIGVPKSTLPRIIGSADRVGDCHPEWFGAPIPICALIGDQQSATIGQGCLSVGQTKLTLGTGAFVLTNLGERRPVDPGRLLGTVLCDVGGVRQFALEGSIFVAGSLIKWLRDDLKMLLSAGESETLARSVPDNGGVFLLPALSGLGAPYWRPNATAVLAGMTFSSTRAHVIRAALEAISHQTVDLAAAFASAGARWSALRIDGGMSANDWLAQDLANMLGLPVERPTDVETTARGAAMLAAVGVGLHPDLATATAAMAPPTEAFHPATDTAAREVRLAGWNRLLAATE